MLHFQNKPVVLDLDDFCEEIMTPALWNNLFILKNHYSNLKINMFTIPLKCSTKWLSMIKKNYPWIEMHYHGSDHENREEWFNKTNIDLPYEEFFYKGFKAPWWRMDQITANTLNKKGFLISAMKGRFDVKSNKIYHFNTGQEHIKSVKYENPKFYTFHSHIQEQKHKDGLPDIFNQAINGFHKNSKFIFISELFK